MEKFQCKKAFSLIELLVSLIIISLFLAAFSPLITKKMKANDVTVGSFGNNSNVSNTRSVTQTDCESLNAVYVPKGPNVEKPICVMKYNIGDGYYNDDWTGVKKCTAGTPCNIATGTDDNITKEELEPVCWTGQTANALNCNDIFGGYSGCKRTVCNWTGANQLCTNIGWRLPTMNELRAFTTPAYSSEDLGANGLMLCGHYSVDSTDPTAAPKCGDYWRGCRGASDENYSCLARHIWSSTFETEYKAWDRYFNTDVWYESNYILNRGFSARCVLDSIEKETKEDEKDCYDFFCESCKNKEHNSCKKCKQGYVLHDGKCYFGTLDGCNSPTYDDTYQVINCASCNTGYTKCNSGSCAKNTSIAKNCPANTIKVGCTCVMQYNIGDGKYTALGEDFSKVKVCTPGVNCEVKNGKDDDTIARNLEAACWDGKLGKTAYNEDPIYCSSNFGNYSGCNRILCNWKGGYKMCNSIGWRLPTMPELIAFTNKTYSSKQAYESENGSLMFCDAATSSISPVCPYLGGNCLGTHSSNCQPYDLWSLSFKTTSLVWYRHLSSDWYESATLLGNSFSVRCIKDL